MGDPTHLEKMGRELKCPVCLSLLNSAVSLLCNHMFCNVCIVKSMKSGSNCPVCKVPYHRREIRAAPHMDNLVSIYKSMEVASGFNIFVTQNASTTKLSDELKKDCKPSCDGEVTGRFCQVLGNDRKPNQKRPRKNMKTHIENCGSVENKPSFPTKKRVQLPRYPLSGAPSLPEKVEVGSGETNGDGQKSNSVSLNNNSLLTGNVEPVLSPFFWLRDDEGVESLSQDADGDQLWFITPPTVPTFSDIKELDEKSPSKSSQNEAVSAKSNALNLFDSQTFRCTQRASPPVLLPSPVKMPGEDAIGIGKNKEERSEAFFSTAHQIEESHVENEKSVNTKQVINRVDDLLPSVLSSSTRGTNNQGDCNKSNKRRKNVRKSVTKKNVDENKGQSCDVSIESDLVDGGFLHKEALDRKGCSSSFREFRKRTKQADFLTNATESKLENIPDYDAREETVNLGDEEMIPELSASLVKTIDCNQDYKIEAASKVLRESCMQNRSMKGSLSSTNKRKLEEACSIQHKTDEDVSAQLLSVQGVENNISETKGEFEEHGKGNRSALFSEDNQNLISWRNKEVRGIPAADELMIDDSEDELCSASAKKRQHIQIVNVVSAKGAQPAEGVLSCLKSRTPDISPNLASKSQANGMSLRKCTIRCAFCHSAENSEVSGEMVHYHNGRPVAADFDAGSKVIHSHRNCTEWAPNVYFEDDTAINLEAELSRSRRIKCCSCGLNGAALGCYEKGCRKSFHVPCAKLIADFRWDYENFVMLCPLHSSSKLPWENPGTKERRMASPQNGKMQNQKNRVVSKQAINTGPYWKLFIGCKKPVLCCSALTVIEQESIAGFERLCGVTVLKKWDSNVTHVIASTDENGACRRTFKFLIGILEGRWILNIEWVKDCMKAMKHVDEEQYEIGADTHGIRDGPRLGRLRLLNKQPKIFEGFDFYLLGDFAPSYKRYLQDLVIAAGGTILQRKPISVLISGSSAPSTFVVYSKEMPENCDPSKKDMILTQRMSRAVTVASTTGAKATSNSWVLDSIAGCKLQNLDE
ncbi:hypothetical protein K2173_000498 [Erythroxylum novogranatense]|uniref:Uncharacterized protein n=1 Tax=Erythroxylum novogranatense TaxID=1862640 RepID=A0AAV8SWL2_9ROSI|nr:hypothetical protein K2173_000498 [Erythroxylum novogranatense]